jgi:hypothetical protein
MKVKPTTRTIKCMAHMSAKKKLIVERVFGFLFSWAILNAWSEFCRYIKSYMLNKYVAIILHYFPRYFRGWGLRSIGRGVRVTA